MCMCVRVCVQVPIAKRPRAPLDKECKAFVQRELQVREHTASCVTNMQHLLHTRVARQGIL